ncbi:senescence regulator [Tanacetum coccineum]
MGGRRRAGLSVAFDDQQEKRIVHQFRNGGDVTSPRGRQVATSAPVNVPDWSKIYRVDLVESMHNDDSDNESSSDQMVPPHEYLACSHSAFNVSEDMLNRFKMRGFRSLLEAGTKADTKHDIGPTCR